MLKNVYQYCLRNKKQRALTFRCRLSLCVCVITNFVLRAFCSFWHSSNFKYVTKFMRCYKAKIFVFVKTRPFTSLQRQDIHITCISYQLLVINIDFAENYIFFSTYSLFVLTVNCEVLK